jgi:molybdopterin molybdotransferase
VETSYGPRGALAPGCLYDSNRFTLAATLTQLGCEVLDLGRVPDDPQALDAVLGRPSTGPTRWSPVAG